MVMSAKMFSESALTVNALLGEKPQKNLAFSPSRLENRVEEIFFFLGF
jgi:hypothetical protein